jgi:hypothetical protein
LLLLLLLGVVAVDFQIIFTWPARAMLGGADNDMMPLFSTAKAFAALLSSLNAMLLSRQGRPQKNRSH